MTGKYALIIANTEYTDLGLARLTAPGKDAEDFARVLKSPEIAAFDKVFTLINRDVFLVNQAIEDFFTGKKPSDLLLLYFSGHGVRDENGALYLAVKNTNRGRLRSTAIKADFIREAMDHSRSKRQLLILDCCNSGAFAQGTKAAIGGSMGTAAAFQGTGYGRIVLTASDATQFAWEGDKVIGETDNSLFTHFLVTGLEGEADLDGDGRITVDELYDYAYEQIVTRTPRQTPGKWSYSQQGEIVLRESKVVETIRPTRLPADLLAAAESTLPYVREGAVRQLEHLLKGRNIGLAQAARALLEKMATEDDSRYIASAARQALQSVPPILEKPLRKEEVSPESPAMSLTQTPPMKMEDVRLMQKKADAIQMARRSGQQRHSSQPTTAPSPVKTSWGRRKPSQIAWIVMTLIGIMLVAYAAPRLMNRNNTGNQNSNLPVNTTIAQQPTLLSTATLATTEVPTEPPTAELVEMRIVPTELLTMTITAPPDIDIPSDPADFLRFYFENVNNRNYDLTWPLLSYEYQVRTNPKGKEQYVDFWDDYIKVEVTSIDYTYLSPTLVKVNFQATFYKESSTFQDEITYFLSRVSNDPQAIWLFVNVPELMCNAAPKRLSVGVNAEVVTLTGTLSLRETASTRATVLEKLHPDTIVRVVDGPTCNSFETGYFWWWKVQAPSGRIGWVVEGSDPADPVFIQPAR
jgi:hypothetical protein